MKKKTIGMMALLLFLFSVSICLALLVKGLPSLPGPKQIAVVKLAGEIGAPGGVLGQDAFIDAARTRQTFESLAEDPLVAAVVLDINSPGGGSAPTADIVYALKDLKDRKPVVAYVSEMGASGGYWLASTSDKLVVSPLSIVGSIGVFSEFVDASKLLSTIGVNYTIIKSGKYKDAGSFARPLTAEESAYMQDLITKVYDEFVSGVADNRGMTVEQLTPLAQGQVFLGKDAVKLGLADKLGTEKDAIGLAKELAGNGTYSVVDITPSPTLGDLLGQLSGMAGRNFGIGLYQALSVRAGQLKI